jgi:adenylosuccinate lyase
MVSAFDSAITGTTYADPEIANYFSDQAEVSAYLRFERELALVQEKLGIIPDGTGA